MLFVVSYLDGVGDLHLLLLLTHIIVYNEREDDCSIHVSTQFPSADREGTFLSFLDRSLGKVETLFLVTILSVYGRNETFLVAFYLDRTDFRCFRNRSLLRETFDHEISCHAFYARYLETDRQVTGGLQGMLNRRQYLHARLLTIDQGGRVDPDGEALLGYFQFRRDVGYQDRDDQQVIAAYEVEAREVLRTRAAFDLYTEVDATAVLSDGRIGFRNVANISSFTTVLAVHRFGLYFFSLSPGLIDSV